MPTIPEKAGVIRRHKDGRVWIKCVDHPEFGTCWVKRAHFVWWRCKRQRVPKGWVLHHRDEEPAHDVMSNLKLMTISAHTSMHAKQRHAEGRLGTDVVWTAESHAKASRSHMGNTALLNHVHSAKTRKKMRAAHKARKENKEFLQSGYGHPWRVKDLPIETQETIG